MSVATDTLEAELAKLKAALEAIATDPHCAYTDGPYISDHDSGYHMGVADGHRCAAAKASAALARHRER